jgi:transcriptional regulator with XRE-family HTH domain
VPSKAAATTAGVRRSALYDGDRQLRRTCFGFGEELRSIRLRAGVSQAAVARAIGVSRSTICEIEAGDESPSLAVRARAAAALGATIRLAIYSGDRPLIRDAAQTALVEGLLRLADRTWKATVEAPVPGPGRRSVDVRLERGPEVVLIEVESRLRAIEEIVRELHGKRAAVTEAAGPDRRVHVVLALPATRHHRELVRALPLTIRAAFPVPSAELHRALTQPSLTWPGDAILWVSGA